MKGSLTTVLALLLAGCGKPQISLPLLNEVQGEINRQVAIYIAWTSQNPEKRVMVNRGPLQPGGQPRMESVRVDDLQVPPGTVTPAGEHPVFACGRGDIDFEIKEIKAELTTTVTGSEKVGFSLAIPANIFTIGPSFDYSHSVTNTQDLTYNLWPQRASANANRAARTMPVTSEGVTATPIAKVLIDLRQALIEQALRFDYARSPWEPRPPKPCYTDYDPQKPASAPGNTFTLGLTVSKETDGAVKVGVSVLTLTGGLGRKSTTGQTITLSFAQPGLEQLQYLQDAVDAECKYPKGFSVECKQALDARSRGRFLVRHGRGDLLPRLPLPPEEPPNGPGILLVRPKPFDK